MKKTTRLPRSLGCRIFDLTAAVERMKERGWPSLGRIDDPAADGDVFLGKTNRRYRAQEYWKGEGTSGLLLGNDGMRPDCAVGGVFAFFLEGWGVVAVLREVVGMPEWQPSRTRTGRAWLESAGRRSSLF